MLVYYEGPFSEKVILKKSDLQHLKARRAKPSELISLCDGNGLVYHTKLLEISSKHAVCQLIESTRHKPKSLPRLVLGIPKLATLEFVLQKATEIGVREIVLLKCEYTPVAFNEDMFQKKKERWDKIIVSACEQSEMYFKPKLSYMTFSQYINMNSKRVMFHPYASSSKISKDADLMVGPEGGWSDQELNAKIDQARLNTGILRVDTACIAALVNWQMI